VRRAFFTQLVMCPDCLDLRKGDALDTRGDVLLAGAFF